jgi:hypothetical protein
MDEYDSLKGKVFEIFSSYHLKVCHMIKDTKYELVVVDNKKYTVCGGDICQVQRKPTWFLWTVVAFIVCVFIWLPLAIFFNNSDLWIWFISSLVSWLIAQPISMAICKLEFSLIIQNYMSLKKLDFSIVDQISLMKKMIEVLQPKIDAFKEKVKKERQAKKAYEEEMIDIYNKIIAMEELDKEIIL